jgi:hypothetical protein
MAARQPRRRPDRPTRVAARATRRVGGRVLAVAAGETGRRVGRAVALGTLLVVLVVTLYDRAEVPSAAAQPAVRGATPASGEPGGPAAGRPGTRRQGTAGAQAPGGLRGRTRPPVAGERPADVAAAWYATRHGLPRHRVRALQQDKLSAREVRVLILADFGPGRLQTALVRVRLTASGWSVR